MMHDKRGRVSSSNRSKWIKHHQQQALGSKTLLQVAQTHVETFSPAVSAALISSIKDHVATQGLLEIATCRPPDGATALPAPLPLMDIPAEPDNRRRGRRRRGRGGAGLLRGGGVAG
eukprot:CAMPEP_0179274636 /NCGR_PEP_ID=MMETSP0797-20121207/33633_1 /TAXON_ID=47934 /ORGANISM="Dinophysis acuminata, Strain DAEP01" /LENGTH=116 /DNA_ID=CAMNT_0020983105 /DNA_START=45 /DNA_END=391 /DNA_ORIENTATION=+